MTGGRGLTALSLPDLEALLAAIDGGKVAAPITPAALSNLLGRRNLDDVARLLGGLPGEAAHAVLVAAIAERKHRSPPHIDLVWTGPESSDASARDTAIVVRQLFEQARTSVLVGGFSFDSGDDIFKPLHGVMTAHGVKATFFLDIQGHADSAAGATAYATHQIDRFFTDNWPFGPPRPDVYYDPRTAAPGPPWASLHAKCVVIDARRTLVTSANFTDRGQTRNIEAGLLVDDPDTAQRLLAHWQGLIRTNLVHRYTG